MEYPFPPPPPGYWIVIAARAILVLWSVIGLGILVFRMWHWKSIQAKESRRWAVAAILGCIVAAYGQSSRPVYDNDLWLTPIFFAALAVPTAGVVACWAKLAMERSDATTMDGVGGSVGLVVSTWAVVGFNVFLINPLSHPREASDRSQCKNNLKQLGLALHNYHDENRAFPPAANGTPPMSWRIAILPFLDQSETYRRYQQNSEWNSSANLPFANKKLAEFICPSNVDPQNAASQWYSAYSMPTGPHSVGSNPRGIALDEITDGSSNTFLVLESCGMQIVWTEPRDVNIQTQPAGINLNGASPGQSAGWLSSHHSGAAHVLRADGSVRWMSAKTDPELLRKFATIDGGEKIDEDY